MTTVGKCREARVIIADCLRVSGLAQMPKSDITSMSDDLWGEYKATEFWVEDHGERFCIMVDKRSLELDRVLTLHRVESWAYVTAHNPRSQLLILEDNALRHQQLLDRIVRDGYSVLEGRGIGSDPDGSPKTAILSLASPAQGKKNYSIHD